MSPKGETWTYITKITPPLFTEVPQSSQESELPGILKIITCLFVVMSFTLSNKNKCSVQIGSSGIKYKQLLIK